MVTYSVPLTLVVVLSTLFLYLFLKNKLRLSFVLIPFLVLLLWTILFTEKSSLSLQSESQRIRTIERVKGYPPIYILPIAHWLEERPETLAFYNLQENFFEILDPGLYFFSNHPRQRVGFKEFEKFSYALLPLFILGLFRLWELQKNRTAFLFLILPIILMTVLGINTPLGPLLLFPFVFCMTLLGLEGIKKRRILFGVFLCIYFLTFIQILSYEIY
jgi:hypothetical protein